MTPTIRPFESGDSAAVLAFARGLPEHDMLFLSRDIQHPRVIAAWADKIAAGEIDSLLAFDGAKVVATSAVVRDPLGWSPHVAELRLLVAPAARGKGLGRTLLHRSFDLAAERGATKLVARMTPDQTAAITLFEELGFRGEALLQNHVQARDGKVHDLVILSHDVARVAGRMAAYHG